MYYDNRSHNYSVIITALRSIESRSSVCIVQKMSNMYRRLQIRCLKFTTIARYACAFDCTNPFTFRQCACFLMEKLRKKLTTDLQIMVEMCSTSCQFTWKMHGLIIAISAYITVVLLYR